MKVNEAHTRNKEEIKETIGKDLPKGFQSADFVLDHGFLDFIVDRKEMKDKLSALLAMLAK